MCAVDRCVQFEISILNSRISKFEKAKESWEAMEKVYQQRLSAAEEQHLDSMKALQVTNRTLHLLDVCTVVLAVQAKTIHISTNPAQHSTAQQCSLVLLACKSSANVDITYNLCMRLTLVLCCGCTLQVERAQLRAASTKLSDAKQAIEQRAREQEIELKVREMVGGVLQQHASLSAINLACFCINVCVVCCRCQFAACSFPCEHDPQQKVTCNTIP